MAPFTNPKKSGRNRVDARRPETITSQLPLHPQLMEIVLHLVLILEQPLNRRLIPHRLADDLGSRLAMDVEKRLVVDL